MKLCVIGGAGYVGLITGVGFAKLGHTVVNFDVDADKVASLARGTSPIYEVGLQEMLQECLDSERLSFTTDLDAAARDAEAVFVAVGSPAGEDGGTDLSQVKSVVTSLSKVAASQSVVVIKSTVPAGTVDLIREEWARRDGRSELHLVVNPEFLREGQGLKDFFYPSRIVVGADSEWARQVMRRLYARFIDGPDDGEPEIPMARGVPLIETTAVNAQIVKYAANAFLATRLSFINEMAGICEQVGADITEVVNGLGYDPRIGWEYLQAGIGFGGPCLEKDLKALIHFSGRHQHDARFMKAVLDRNDRQVQHIVEKIVELLGPELSQKRVAILGLAFKLGTNDVRTSLSLRIMRMLLDRGCVLTAHDPVALSEAQSLLPEAHYSDDLYRALDGADALVLLTDWPEYGALDLERIAGLMRQKNVVDGRNMLERGALERLEFRYRGVGR